MAGIVRRRRHGSRGEAESVWPQLTNAVEQPGLFVIAVGWRLYYFYDAAAGADRDAVEG
jgi:hypothetical protein